MPSPDDIRRQRFLVALRGYEREEVEAYLSEVADQMSGLRDQVAGLERELEAARSSAAAAGAGAIEPRQALKSLGEETTRILVAAEESAQEIIRKAEAAAQKLDAEARLEVRNLTDRANSAAARTIAEAERRRDRIAEEIKRLDEHRSSFLDRLGSAVRTVSTAVGGLDENAPQTQEPPAPTSVPEAAPAVAAAPAAGPAAPAAAPAAPAAAPAAPAAPAPEVVEPPAATVQTAQPSSADATSEPAPAASDDGDAVAAPEAAVDGGEQEDVTEPHADAVAELEETAPPEPSTPRARVLEVRVPEATRACKRALQDVQNVVLASIRANSNSSDLQPLLPTDDDLEIVGAAAAGHLGETYASALEDAATAVEGKAPTSLEGGARVNAAVAAFTAVVASEVTSSLRATLRAGLEAGEPDVQLSERVGEVFRDLRGPVIEALVGEHLLRTYEHGLLDAWEQLGVTKIRWKASEEPRCPEGKCRSNAAEGLVELGTDFPSGDRVPPAHPGCRCTIVPAGTSL